MIRHNLEVFADYNQFYLWDPSAGREAPEEYSGDDVRRRVKTAPHVVVIQPARNDDVSVELQLHEGPPELVLEQWDHVVECGLELPSGKLEIHECTGGPVLEVDVAPGSYTVRALFTGLSAAQEGKSDDRYTLQVWPGASPDLRVLKQWETPAV